jgi:putative FmdB family regulatory protein
MPLYEYECEACGNRFEAIQKFSDPAIEACPKCGGQVRKLIAAPAFQFKGSGWYITDYARKDAGTKDEGAKKEGGGADAKGEKADKADRADRADSADRAEKSEKPAGGDSSAPASTTSSPSKTSSDA